MRVICARLLRRIARRAGLSGRYVSEHRWVNFSACGVTVIEGGKTRDRWIDDGAEHVHELTVVNGQSSQIPSVAEKRSGRAILIEYSLKHESRFEV